MAIHGLDWIGCGKMDPGQTLVCQSLLFSKLDYFTLTESHKISGGGC